MTTTIRRRAAAALASVLCLAAVACGGGGGAGEAVQDDGTLSVDGEVIAPAELFAAAQKEGTVNVYTSLNKVTNSAVAKAFEEDTGIKVEGIVTPTGRLFERIQSEAGSGALPADVIGMPDESLFSQLVDDKMFVPHRVPNDAEIPQQYKFSDGLYYALSSAPTVIAYNSGVIDEKDVPKKWADLPSAGTDQQRIGMVHASQGAGGWGLALFMRKTFGDNYWRQLASAKPVLESSVGSLAEKLGRGEIAIAAARPPEVGGLQEQGAPVDYIWPEDGTPMFNFYLAQVAKGQHPNAAQVYINWSLSKRGQSVLATEGGDYPVNPKAALPVINGKELPPLDDVHPAIADSKDWVSLRDQWIAEWNDVFGYRP
jgi:iron(III) transport system substrate-binding protein